MNTKTRSSHQNYQSLHDTVRGVQHRVEKVARAAKKAVAHASAVAAHMAGVVQDVENQIKIIGVMADSNLDVRSSVGDLREEVRTLTGRLQRLMHDPQPVVFPRDASRIVRHNMIQRGVGREVRSVVHRMLREGVSRRSITLTLSTANDPRR